MNASGGIERIVYNLIDAWKEFFEIELIVKDNGECFYGTLDDIAVTSLETPRLSDMTNRGKRILSTLSNSLMSCLRLKRTLKEKNFDFVYVTTPLNTAELFLAGVPGRKIIVSEHGSAFGINKVYMKMKDIFYPKVRAISVPNKIDTEYYKKRGFNSVYIPHLVKDKERNRASGENHVVLNVGRLTDDKRQDNLIECWSRINNKGDWQLWIVGTGENYEKLIDMTKRLQIDDVFFFPETKNIEEMYLSASVFAFTSRFEGFGLVLTEAMAYGLPCIAYDCPSGPKDIIDNGKNGFLIENSNSVAYSDKLDYLIHMDAGERSLLSDNAYMTIQEWDNDKIIEKWLMLFGRDNDEI